MLKPHDITQTTVKALSTPPPPSTKPTTKPSTKPSPMPSPKPTPLTSMNFHEKNSINLKWRIILNKIKQWKWKYPVHDFLIIILENRLKWYHSVSPRTDVSLLYSILQLSLLLNNCKLLCKFSFYTSNNYYVTNDAHSNERSHAHSNERSHVAQQLTFSDATLSFHV